MIFEIKHRLTGSVLFSIETSTWRLAVEAAFKSGANLCDANLRGANLRGADLCDADLCGADLCDADLCGANLRGADLRGANLRGANLRGADLCDADLCGADLCDANLRGADLCDANLRGANLRGAKGIDKNRITPLRILLEQPGPIWAYKLVNKTGEGPFQGGINYLRSEEFTVRVNSDENEQCGAGINLATLDWVMREWKPGYRILIMEFFANEPTKGNLVIPTNTDGKFRVGNCRRVGEKDLKELGLVK